MTCIISFEDMLSIIGHQPGQLTYFLYAFFHLKSRNNNGEAKCLTVTYYKASQLLNHQRKSFFFGSKFSMILEQ